MNHKYNKLTAAVVAMLGLTASGMVVAAGQFPTTRDAPGTCDNVRWHKDMVAQFPKVIAACQEVVIAKDGSKWARFESIFERVEDDGTLTFGVRNSQGTQVDEVSLTPSVGQVAYIDGHKTEFKELRYGQPLNLYMPDGGSGLSTQYGVAPSEIVSVRPPAAASVQRTDQNNLQLESVQFALDSSALTPTSKRILDSHARSLIDNPTTNIVITGHTSASASNAYNQSLSERRARAVMEYLASIPGVNAGQLKMIGHGEMHPIARENPAASANSKEARANMRVAFEVAAR